MFLLPLFIIGTLIYALQLDAHPLETQTYLPAPSKYFASFMLGPGNEYGSFVRRFRKIDLVFTLEIPHQDDTHPFWRRLSDEVDLKLSLRLIDIPNPENIVTPASPLEMLWDFLDVGEAKIPSLGKVVQLRANQEILAQCDFTPAAVLNYAFKNPDRASPDDSEMLLMICTYNPMSRPTANGYLL